MKDTILWLKLPQRTKPDSHNLYSSIADISQWIERTAQIKTGEQARLYFSLLVEINSLDIPVQERINSLEKLHMPVIKLVEKLSRKYSGSGLPLSEEKSRYVELVNDFWFEMAIGHKIIIDDLSNSGFFSSMFNQKDMVSAIHYVFYYLTHQVYYNFMLYAGAQAEIWRDIHQLFQFASNRHLIHKSIAKHFSTTLTIEEEYKKILLFSLANPFHLSNDEMTQLWTQLDDLVKYSQLSLNTENVIENQFPFLIKPYSDRPPFANQTKNKLVTDKHRVLADLNSELVWGLDPKKLLKKLQKNKASDDISGPLRNRLLRVWSGDIFRNDSRNELIEPVVIALGGSCVSQFLSQIEIESKIIKLDDDIEQELEPTPTVQTIYHTFLIDESEHGFRMKLSPESEKIISPRMGEVVAIKHCDNNIRTGYLRWIRKNKNAEIEFGIEHLSSKAEPVQILLTNTKNNFSVENEPHGSVDDNFSDNFGSTKPGSEKTDSNKPDFDSSGFDKSNTEILDSFVFPGGQAEHYKPILFTHSFIEKFFKSRTNLIKLRHKTGTINIQLTDKVDDVLDYSLYLFEKAQDDLLNEHLSYQEKTEKFKNMWEEI